MCRSAISVVAWTNVCTIYHISLEWGKVLIKNTFLPYKALLLIIQGNFQLCHFSHDQISFFLSWGGIMRVAVWDKTPTQNYYRCIFSVQEILWNDLRQFPDLPLFTWINVFIALGVGTDVRSKASLVYCHFPFSMQEIPANKFKVFSALLVFT